MLPFPRAIVCPAVTSLWWDAFGAVRNIRPGWHSPNERDNAAFESAVHSVFIRGKGRQHC